MPSPCLAPRTSGLVAWLLALVAVVLLAPGCAYDKAGASPGYSADEVQASRELSAYGDDYGGEGSYDFEDDLMEGEVLAPEGANMSSRARSKHSAMIDKRGNFASEMAEAPPAEPEAEPAPKPAPDEVSPEQPKPVASQRQIIYTATMQVSVYDVERSLEVATGLPDRLGGWLHQRNDNQLILRIPAERLEEAMALIAELGVVDYRLLEALDVTAEYTDLQSRIRVLEEMQAQLQKLLTKAKSVEQALEIRQALDRVTMELELARARMRELSKSIAFSTLIIRIVARGPVADLPSSNDPFPWVLELGVEATEYR